MKTISLFWGSQVISGAWHDGPNQRTCLLAMGAMVLLSACASSDQQKSMQSLVGTKWQLQSIQSMDDAQGTTAIPDPSRFTVFFGPDGRATFRLDCNRGVGTWKVDSTNDQGGRLTFSPIAATRALCAPPNLDERVVRDMPYVRSFVLKDHKLYFSLMADGGIYEWHPMPSPSSPDSSPLND